MTEYNINEMQYQISERISEIRKLRAEIINFITVDNKMKIIIDPEYVDKAKSLEERISKEQDLNLHEIALVKKLRELIAKYNFIGGYFPGNDIFCLDGIIERAQNELRVMENHFQVDVLRMKIENPPAAAVLEK